MSLLFWRETVCLKRMLAPKRSCVSSLFFCSAAAFSRLNAVPGVPSSAKHLFQKCVSRQPCYSLQLTSQGHFWAPRTIVPSVCRKCQQNKAGCARKGFAVAVASRRNFAVSSRLRQKAKDDLSKQTLRTESKTAVVPKTSDVKKLLSLSRPEKWKILGWQWLY